MKTNKRHIIIPALMMAVGVGLVGSISGTVAWYQYSTRATTSYIGNSNKCSENLQISLSGLDNAYKSELNSNDILAGAIADKDGSKLQPVTPGVAQTAAKSTTDGEISSMYGHPMYQNFEYSTWQAAPADSYLQYDLFFRVLDVDGAATKSYLAKKVYIEDITLNFTPTNTSGDADEFKNALRIQFDRIENSVSAERILLSNTATSALELGGKLDLNGDGAMDKEWGYSDWQTLEEKEYGNKALKQTTAAFADYENSYVNGKLAPTAGTELGTTTAGEYSASSALHFKVTVWLEGWANTQMWDAADYIGSFQLGMTFGVTAYGEE